MRRASESARQTVSDLTGKVISRTPRCHSASITALPIAAGAPIAPPSLSPFTPSGLLGAALAREVVPEAGTSAARGTPEAREVAGRSCPEDRAQTECFHRPLAAPPARPPLH